MIMITEHIQIEKKETAIKVRNTQIESIRNKHILRKGVRVYDQGYIGISGCIGDTPDDVLIQQAKDNLAVQIQYPFEVEKNKREHRNYIQSKITPEALYEYTDSILKTLRKDYPEFDFSETASINQVTYQMKNSEGLELSYTDSSYQIGLLLKEKKSANLFDGFLMNYGRQMDLEKFWSANHALLKAYSNPVDLPEEKKLPIIFLGHESFTAFLNRCLNGESYGVGSSLFSGKLNQKLFNSRINISQYANSEKTLEPFFDSEGITLERDCHPLIEKGIFTSVFTDKKMAKKYDLPHTGAARGEYDGIPSLSSTNIHFESDATDLKSKLQGKPALVVMISSGGDFTPDGDYAAPVQVGFLFDGEKLVGKLPEFSIRSSLFKALGDDYVGTFDNQYFYTGDIESQILVTEMEIVK